MDTAIHALKKQLVELQQARDSGAVTPAYYEDKKTALERQLLDEVLKNDGGTAQHTEPSDFETTRKSAAKTSSALLYTLITVGVIAVAAAGYGWTGSPTQTSLAVPVATDTDATAGASQVPNMEQIASMVERLAEKLRDQPDDAEGWAMLARSYSFLGRNPDALIAYEKATALRKDDPTLLADYADAMAVKNNRSLKGEPMKQVMAALKLDPRNLKALALAGAEAFERKDYKSASQYWGDVVQFGPAENPLVQEVKISLAEARQLAGLPAAREPASVSADTKAVVAAADTALTGTVSLSAELQKIAQPDDTVYIFARASEGSRMPLAILKTQVRNLPASFRLDDTSAMSPANKLSTANQVIVGARVSKSGNAMPQPGDLVGQSAIVKVGSTRLQIEIKDTVKP